MRGIARWNRRAGAWIEDIIADLCGVEGARIDDPVKRGGVADRSDAKEADLALLPQSLEGRDDLTEHSLGGKAAVAAICSNMIVQLEQIDAIELQALQARLQRGRDRRAGPAAFAVRNAHFSADYDVGLQTLDDASEITLGFAITIHRGGIEIVNAELDRASHRPLLVGGIAAYHQPADGTASEPEERNVEPGPAECAFFHRLLRCFDSGADQIPSVRECQSCRKRAGRGQWTDIGTGGSMRKSVPLLGAFLLAGAAAALEVAEAAASRTKATPHPDLIDDLVAANRILSDQGVVDGFGHVSVRHDTDPARFLLARSMAPGLVSADDILSSISTAMHSSHAVVPSMSSASSTAKSTRPIPTSRRSYTAIRRRSFRSARPMCR